MRSVNWRKWMRDAARVGLVVAAAFAMLALTDSWPFKHVPSALEEAKKAGVNVGQSKEEQKQWSIRCLDQQKAAERDGAWTWAQLVDACVRPEAAAAKRDKDRADAEDCIQGYLRAKAAKGQDLTADEFTEACPFLREAWKDFKAGTK